MLLYIVNISYSHETLSLPQKNSNKLNSLPQENRNSDVMYFMKAVFLYISDNLFGYMHTDVSFYAILIWTNMRSF